MEKPDFANFKILLVGAKNHSVQTLRAVLGVAGITRITHVIEPERAIMVLRMESFSAVFCEQDLAPLNGVPFAIAARRLPGILNPMIPIFLLRDRARRRDVEQARDIGATDFVTTPISPRTLMTKLRTALPAPRPFIVSPGFFGPDRRSRTRPGYLGFERRIRAPRKAKVGAPVG